MNRHEYCRMFLFKNKHALKTNRLQIRWKIKTEKSLFNPNTIKKCCDIWLPIMRLIELKKKNKCNSFSILHARKVSHFRVL